MDGKMYTDISSTNLQILVLFDEALSTMNQRCFKNVPNDIYLESK